MYGQPDGTCLIRNRPADRLPDPPCRIGGKFVAAPVFELVDRFHQADVAFLDQVEKLQPAIAVFLGDRNHQAQIGFDQFALGLLRVHVALDHFALSALQVRKSHSSFVLESFNLNAMLPLRSAIIFLQLFTACTL